jgi:hypothetical protein
VRQPLKNLEIFMSEAPQEGTPLSIANAVDALLDQTAPEEDTPVEEEEAATETAEVEVEADAEELESEDIAEGDDTEDDDEEAEVVEASAEEPETYRVRVGEDEVDLTLDELQLGYMRQSDYTRKTQQIAENRKKAEAELDALLAQRESYAAQLEQISTALNQSEPTQEYWELLQNEDPIEYVKQREAWRDQRDARAQVQAEQERVRQEQYEQLQAQLQEHRAQEAEKLLDVIPEWRDERIAQKERSALHTYAMRDLGYTESEVGRIADHRAIKALRKAHLYDELMKSKPAATKKAAKAPKMAKAGTPTSKKQLNSKRKRQALQNINKQRGRQSVDAAVDYLLQK